MIDFTKESQSRVLRVAEMRAEGQKVCQEDIHIVGAMDIHPEFDEIWQEGELACYPREIDGKVVNPFVHIVLHVRINRQIQNEEPYFVSIAHRRLTGQGSDPHESLHAIISEYADIYFETFRKGESFDHLAYQVRIEALNYVKKD